MEPLDEPISARTLKINSRIVGGKTAPKWGPDLINRDSLLDSLQALYDECSLDALKQQDRRIAVFADKFRSSIRELKRLRPNAADFEIKSTIGRGQFGEVRIVKERQTGDIYAMKTVKKSDSCQTSFEIERDLMAFADSQWLTKLKYSFQDNTHLFFIMDYHPGGDLLGLLYRQGGTLPESASIFYIAEVILALQDLHSLGYVHRDIKPDNILLDRCGHVKLADFGSAAKLINGLVTKGPPVGTPDYVAPEVLLSMEGKQKQGYGVGCDFWSLGVVGYELAVGKTPFRSASTTTTYHKIMGFSGLKFPPDVVLSQAFVSFIKALITEEKSRLSNFQRVKCHDLFRGLDFDSLRDQVPPYVPKVVNGEDSSNFGDVVMKKQAPSLDNLKKRQFSGKNLPFVGFSYTPHINQYESANQERANSAKNDLIRNLRSEVENLRRNFDASKDFEELKLNLERKLNEKSQKFQTLEDVRTRLEKDLSASMAENLALKRTLEIERKDRSELERKALDLIKSAKIKWEASERQKIQNFELELSEQNQKITELVSINELLKSQLGTALKQEEKRRESNINFECLSRKSVLGLENRLEKVSIDHKVVVNELQKDLEREKSTKTQLQREINDLKLKENNSEKVRAVAKTEYENLKKKMMETEVLVSELNRKLQSLEGESQKIDYFQIENSQLKSQLNQTILHVKDLEKRLSLLNSEKLELSSYKNRCEDLTKQFDQSRKQIHDLESKLDEEKAKNSDLVKNLENVDRLEECQEIKELRSKLWRVERDLSNAKLDKRILERELKDSENKSKSLQEEVKVLDEKLSQNRKSHEKAMLELGGFNEELSLELVKTKDEVKILQERLENQMAKGVDLKMGMMESKNLIGEHESKIASLLGEIDELKKSLNRSQLDGEKSLDLIGRLEREKSEFINEIGNLKTQNQVTNLNLEALREACTLLENQVIEYEKLAANVELEKSSLNSNLDQLVKDLCEARSQTQDARKLVNEEKSLRLLAETKVKRLNEDVECLKNECQSYKSQCLEFKDCAANLSEELNVCEEKIGALEVTIKSYERRIVEVDSENVAIKEEMAQCLTQLGATREANFKSKQQLHEYKDSNKALLERLDELERTLCAKSRFFEEREMKFESTIQQQTKLIDYLQTKIDEASHKKKSFADKLFGHSKKENQPPPATPPPNRGLDIEIQLKRQKDVNRNQEEEIHRLKQELLTLKVGTSGRKVERHKSEILSPSRPNFVTPPSNIRNVENDSKRLELISKLPKDIGKVTSLLEVGPKFKLIGSSAGLYAIFDSDSLVKIDGLDEILSMKILKPVHVVVMVTGSRGLLVSADLNHVTNLANNCTLNTSRPSLSYKRASDLEQFHFVEVSEVDSNLMLCGATSKQIIVANYDLDLMEFVTYRVMDTMKPTTCALFTELTLIVGADRFFEIDLATFDAEEFLDRSDPQIKQALKCLKLGSFPLSILKVGDSPKEYLVCFKEVFVFVDEYGRSSRSSEFVPKFAPFKVDLIGNYLYSCHFEGVEVFKLSDCFNRVADLSVRGVEMMGRGRKGVYVLFEGSVYEIIAGKVQEGVGDSSLDTTDESDRFSFTSSIVRSLDGNLSDAESSLTEAELNNVKKVTFS